MMGQGVTISAGGPLLSPGVVAMQSAPPPSPPPTFIGWIADRLAAAGLEDLADDILVDDARRRLGEDVELRKVLDGRGLRLYFGPVFKLEGELVQKVELAIGDPPKRVGDEDLVPTTKRQRLRETARRLGIRLINSRRYRRGRGRQR